MKLKYYLRGLGVGIVAMGLIMIITSLNNKTMSDDEVIARARELGMEFSTTLSNMKAGETEETVDYEVTEDKETATQPVEEVKEEPKESVADENTADNTDAATQEETGEDQNAEDKTTDNAEENGDAADNGEDTVAEKPANDNKPAEKPADNQNADDGTEEYVVLTISPGDGSDKLSIKAAELGLVESSSEFDNFLISNGYANRLRVGSYEVKVGSSFEEIVNAIFN